MKFFFGSPVFLGLVNDNEEEIVYKQAAQFALVMVSIRQAIVEGLEDKASLEQILNILEAKGKLPGTKVQLRPLNDKNGKRVQLIIKWGGLFTHGGMHHSRELGERLRTDLNIINKELIQDMQVWCSSERRVIDTAETFCSALLQSKINPSEDLFVTKEMLDDSNCAKEQTDAVKQKLQYILNPEFKARPPAEFVMPEGWTDFSQPVREIIELLKELRIIMNENLKILKESDWCCFENKFLFKERWEKLFKEFCDVPRDKFEPSKISELYDTLKFDLIHNRQYLSECFKDPKSSNDENMMAELWRQSKALFDIIGPHEYGN